MQNARSGAVLTFVLFTLMLCACVTMALAVFIMKEKADRYKKTVPILIQRFNQEKLNNRNLEKKRLEIKEDRDRLRDNFDKQVENELLNR